MSDVCKDIGAIWSRLFDHRGFLSGETNLILKEFEQKRGDSEVDNLFKAIENSTDIKHTEIERFKQAADQVLPNLDTELKGALSVCNKFADVERQYKECDRLKIVKQQRQAEWENFMDYITTSYSKINSLTEIKEKNLQKTYSELEKKLHI